MGMICFKHVFCVINIITILIFHYVHDTVIDKDIDSQLFNNGPNNIHILHNHGRRIDDPLPSPFTAHNARRNVNYAALHYNIINLHV